jgi:hypothetical protein
VCQYVVRVSTQLDIARSRPFVLTPTQTAVLKISFCATEHATRLEPREFVKVLNINLISEGVGWDGGVYVQVLSCEMIG